jgi:hypothetical protein
VQAYVPLLLGLDIFDKYKQVVNNVDDRLEGRSNPPNSKALWNEKVTRKHGHLYLCPPFAVNLSRAQPERLHKHFFRKVCLRCSSEHYPMRPT